MNKDYQKDFREIKDLIQSNKVLKTALYVGAGVLALYLTGKALSVLANTVRGFNDFKSAIRGS